MAGGSGWWFSMRRRALRMRLPTALRALGGVREGPGPIAQTETGGELGGDQPLLPRAGAPFRVVVPVGVGDSRFEVLQTVCGRR